jgi:hypothetical protein
MGRNGMQRLGRVSIGYTTQHTVKSTSANRALLKTARDRCVCAKLTNEKSVSGSSKARPNVRPIRSSTCWSLLLMCACG